MTFHRWDARRDGNELAIVDALERAGCLVERISGAGVPDLLVYSPFRHRIVLLEVKQPKGKLREKQDAFFARWDRAPVYRVDNVEDALAVVKLGRRALLR